MKMKDSVINKQAARIAELESLAESRLEQMNADRKAYLDLRRKIDEAPVVAWFSRTSHAGYGGIWNYQTDETDTPLISKEDLT